MRTWTNVLAICFQWVWSWYSKKMSEQHPLCYARASADTQDNRMCADKPCCSGHHDSCSVAVVRCTSRLIIDARSPRSTRLFATCGHLLTRYTRTCGCLHELGWPSFNSVETPAAAVWAGAHLPRCRMIPILWPHPMSDLMKAALFIPSSLLNLAEFEK